MFNLGISGLVAAYVLIALLLLGMCVRSGWSWKIKAALIMITTAFYVVTYFSYPQILGWPVTEQPPQKFRLLAAHIERPDPQTRSGGAIYLWLAGIDDLLTPAVPRAYRFAYSDALRVRVQNASSKLNRGIAQLGEIEHRNDRHDGAGGNMSGPDAKSVNMLFYDLPDTMFPER